MTDKKRFKDFGIGGDVSNEPLSFMLHGEEFNCYPAMQGKVLLDFIARSNNETAGAMAGIIHDFFEKVMFPESFERFVALLDDPNRVVTVEALGEITAWLMEEYSTRPTQQPEHSSTGQ